MKIYAVADIHGRKDRIDLIESNISKLRPDVLIVAGDITSYTNSVSVISRLNNMPVPVLAVRGNTDLPKVESLLEQFPNASSIHLRQITIKDVTFVGVSGTIPVPFYSRICFEEKKVVTRLESLVKRSTVLVAHPPPRGVLDEAFGRFHAGCRSLFEVILRCRPKLFICGHIHERPGVEYIGTTLVVNCSIGRTGGGAIMEYDGDRDPSVEMLP
ncbi:MAG: metallophosphoesterase family protein [Deltaproteobacteria bacterium]|nr:metallophosphoesterase family protein [Deltaproteobacteria bacterium]MBW2648821.1 metallophosphoesterase family protein [Deltaproteobacteria bacterium]